MAAAKPEVRHVILVVFDTLRRDAVGCYRHAAAVGRDRNAEPRRVRARIGAIRSRVPGGVADAVCAPHAVHRPCAPTRSTTETSGTSRATSSASRRAGGRSRRASTRWPRSAKRKASAPGLSPICITSSSRRRISGAASTSGRSSGGRKPTPRAAARGRRRTRSTTGCRASCRSCAARRPGSNSRDSARLVLQPHPAQHARPRARGAMVQRAGDAGSGALGRAEPRREAPVHDRRVVRSARAVVRARALPASATTTATAASRSSRRTPRCRGCPRIW